jgi:positive regulator of sigma E activity
LYLPQVSNDQEKMRLRVAFLHWLGCLSIFILLAILVYFFSSKLFENLAILFYLGAGFYLSRSVLRKIIEWHPTYSTLYNVTSAKLKFFWLWPIAYFFLFVRLGINKIL